MKILLLHNYYQQPGGEDIAVEQEKGLLNSKGHEVRLLTASNDQIKGIPARVKAAMSTIYSVHSKKRVEEELCSFQPAIVHVHNFFPLLSPSVYYACRSAGVPVVQTLHNFRLLCSNALLFRDGKPCEQCVGKKLPWPGIVHACYRRSFAGSAALACMLTAHRVSGTWDSAVDAYIALTRFSKQKLIEGGIPAGRIFIKPNFVFHDPEKRRFADNGYALFVGRLSGEKGITNLISAWKRVHRNRTLKIIGTGPLEEIVRAACTHSSGIEVLGHQSAPTVMDLMESASFLIFPSECYEGLPRVIIEAFAKGLPVLASRLGSMAELVEDQRTGILFRPGDARDLANKIEWMFTHPAQLKQMSEAVRWEFEAKYMAERNYKMLMEIYQYAADNAPRQYSSRRRGADRDTGVDAGLAATGMDEKILDQVPI